MMNPALRNLVYAAVSVSVFVPGIYLAGDYLYFQIPLEQIRMFDDTFDRTILDGLREGDRCYEIRPDEFACRTDRKIFFPQARIQFSSAGPAGSYGETVWVPEGETDVCFFSIASMEIADHAEKAILIDFGHHPDCARSGVFHTATMLPGDTYVECYTRFGGIHIVTYTDLVPIRNETYAEFWGVHATLPGELIPCDVPKIIKRSLEIRYDVGLPEYDDEHFTVS